MFKVVFLVFFFYFLFESNYFLLALCLIKLLDKYNHLIITLNYYLFSNTIAFVKLDFFELIKERKNVSLFHFALLKKHKMQEQKLNEEIITLWTKDRTCNLACTIWNKVILIKRVCSSETQTCCGLSFPLFDIIYIRIYAKKLERKDIFI